MLTMTKVELDLILNVDMCSILSLSEISRGPSKSVPLSEFSS